MTHAEPATPRGLTVRELTKTYDTGATRLTVLSGVSLAVGSGESLAVTGPSGSGKSTLLQLIGTLDRPTSGEVRLDGENAFALAEPELARFRNEQVGFVFQDHHLLPQLTVLENVLVPCLAFGPAAAGAEKRARELLTRVGLADRLHHRPTELSGGERQRVAVARALIREPRLLLCDEPTGNLDRKTAHEVADLLFELHRDAGNILIVVTHSPELAARFPRRVELLDGQCVAA